MGMPVRIHDTLYELARAEAKVERRTIAGQIEFWASLGRALEPLLRGDRAMALCRSGKARSLSACLASVDSPAGRQQVVEHLNSRPFPHYEAAPDMPGLLVRIEANGRRTVGRFVNRQFQASGVAHPVPAKTLGPVE